MKSKSGHFLFESELNWENPAPGVTRQIMGYDGQLMLVKVAFESGAVAAVHSHYHSQSSYVASGKYEVMVAGETKTLSAGDGFYTEPDVEHGVTCIEEGIVIDTFAPVRVDFLQ
ncbi:MAG: cupin domain-containing protein [Rikenellaceae bacterium]